MRPRILAALVLAVLLLVPSPAAAKGPSQVEVHNLRSGTTTMLNWDQPELTALMELVEWPAARRKPHLVANGDLTHVATLAWQFDDGTPVWLDRVFSDGSGTAWVARRDHLSGNAFVTWGRVRAAYALDVFLTQLEAPAAAEIAASSTTTQSSTTAGLDRSSFGFGAAAAGLACLLVGSLGLALRRRRSLQP